MTPPYAIDAPPLRTPADVLERVTALVGPAVTDNQLWVMFVDGDDRQSPVLMPISDVAREPDPGQLANLGRVLAGLRDDLATAAGPGSVIFTLERQCSDAVLPTDRAWAGALAATCEQADVGLRGVFLSTSVGISRLR